MIRIHNGFMLHVKNKELIMNNLSLAIYSHSSYYDCLTPCLDRFKRYCKYEFDHKFLLLDQEDNFEGYDILKYTDAACYTARLVETVSQIPTDYLLFLHEDMILYEAVGEAYLDIAVKTIMKDDVDCIKLIKCDDNFIESSYRNSIFLKSIPTTANLLFAVQPTLWNKESYVKVLKANPNKNIWQLEASGQGYAKENNYNCLYTYDQRFDRKRGKYHYDSCTFPYIATAIVKGKWNITDYPKEMIEMLDEYKIDPNVRGIR